MKKFYHHDPEDTKHVTVIVYDMTEADWFVLSVIIEFRLWHSGNGPERCLAREIRSTS